MGPTWFDHGKNKITAIVLNTESCIPSLLEKTDVLVLHLDSKGSFLLARPMNILQFSLNDIVSSLFLHACWSLPLHFLNELHFSKASKLFICFIYMIQISISRRAQAFRVISLKSAWNYIRCRSSIKM